MLSYFVRRLPKQSRNSISHLNLRPCPTRPRNEPCSTSSSNIIHALWDAQSADFQTDRPLPSFLLRCSPRPLQTAPPFHIPSSLFLAFKINAKAKPCSLSLSLASLPGCPHTHALGGARKSSPRAAVRREPSAAECITYYERVSGEFWVQMDGAIRVSGREGREKSFRRRLSDRVWSGD